MTEPRRPWFAQASDAKQAKLSHEALLTVLNYDPGSGVFTWRVCPWRPYLVGTEAGCAKPGGRVITINTVRYLAHRLAWFYMTKTWPTGEIDHRDTDPLNNKWANLRDGDRFQNMQNLSAPKRHNTTGLLGASRNGHQFCSKIQVNGKMIYLGSFPTAQLAHEAYMAAKRKHHPGATICA